MRVSRETQERLRAFALDLVKWNGAINLVAKSTLNEIWSRHILDSAQVFDAAPSGVKRWCDMGSGGGLPGVVSAIIALEREPELNIILIESDRRKAAFLKLQIGKHGLNARVLQQRIEESPPCVADVVSARALAPLTPLLVYAHRHLVAGGTALFLKGKSCHEEVDVARRTWQFDLECKSSKTDANGCVLIVKNLRTLERQP